MTHGPYPRLTARQLLFAVWLASLAPAAFADTVSVAVASNFANPLKQLQPLFEQQSDHRLRISSASTGTLYAQIRNGAPYDVFLSADRARPERLIAEGLAEESSAFVYARGRLILWSPDPDLVDGHGAVLRSGDFEHLALANPRTAPYGAAAMQVLRELGLAQSLAGRIVQGENIAQTWQFVATRNAELGFVALSQPIAANLETSGSRWLVPQSMYDPIEQMAVLLAAAHDEPAAREFMQFLQSSKAVRKIRQLGYDAGPDKGAIGRDTACRQTP